MAYRDYRSPGINVIIERTESATGVDLTDFLPVFVGTGMTSRSRTITNTRVKADVTEYPVVKFEWDVVGNFNMQIFDETIFNLLSLAVYSGDVPTTLTAGTQYEIVSPAQDLTSEGRVTTVVRILDALAAPETNLYYDFAVSIENSDNDFDLRLITAEDRYYARDIFGPHELEENGTSFFNDVAFAAEIAFRAGVERFFYMEVPRNYGGPATTQEMIDALDAIYYKTDAYRIVPLTNDAAVHQALSGFTTSLSNPVDRREVVGFTGVDPASLVDINDIDELVEKVGGFSESMDNERIMNVFGGSSVELVISSTRYVLPMYFMSVAIASLDTKVGMSEPLSTREISVFSKLNGPRFRPRDWDKLARYGVFIIHQPESNGPIVIRHQLTTKQSDAATMQEYSMVKNFDAVTKRIRDRMSPYAGSLNITDGYMERIDASFTSAVEEVKQLGWARDIITLSPWALRQVGSGDSMTEESRNLVGKFQLVPVYPANNLDVYLIV